MCGKLNSNPQTYWMRTLPTESLPECLTRDFFGYLDFYRLSTNFSCRYLKKKLVMNLLKIYYMNHFMSV